MQSDNINDLLKTVLENLHNPNALNNHAWGKSQILKEYLSRHTEFLNQPVGSNISAAICELFTQWMPVSAPRQGKRIDTRWGEFGILAAYYWSPYLFGAPQPRTLREAWQFIDDAILLFMFGKYSEPDETQRAKYKLVAGEVNPANSTISDWHRKGIERFAAFIANREQYLLTHIDDKDHSTEQSKEKFKSKTFSMVGKIAIGFLTLLLVIIGVLGYQKARHIQDIVHFLQSDLSQAQKIETSFNNVQSFTEIPQLLADLDKHITDLDREIRPYLGALSWFTWLPTYGGDVSNTTELLDMTVALNKSLQYAYLANSTILKSIASDDATDLKTMIKLIEASQDNLQASLKAFEQAQFSRSKIDTNQLSPRLRELIVEKIDPNFLLLERVLKAEKTLPYLLGIGKNGPRTYLIVLQNEDELRPTGGFLTAIGSVVIQNGEIVSMKIEDSTTFDDINKPFALAPWQLNEYMGVRLLYLRDANWIVDFPTTANEIEFLYAYSRSHTADGIITLDQQSIIHILNTVGPIQVEGVNEPVTSANVVEFMRKSKIPPAEQNDPDWNRKEFMSNLAEPIVRKIMAGEGISFKKMVSTLYQALAEKHILLQFDDPSFAKIIAEQGWDGSVTPPDSDFLMVVEANIGYSKANAIIQQSIQQTVDLSSLNNPLAHLEVDYYNPGKAVTSCDQVQTLPEERYYAISRCHGVYLRVYTPNNTQLVSATPHSVPADWTERNQFVPAKIDILTDDQPGFSVFGTYFVVPLSESLSTSFDFALPKQIIRQDDKGLYTYKLKIQKQPGTLGIPVTLKILLPQGAQVQHHTGIMSITSNILSGQFDLYKDQWVEVQFLLP